MDEENRLIWLDGKIVELKDAKVNALSPTAQFGLNVFEGIPCYWNEEREKMYAFRLEAHYDRLLRSAGLLEIQCPYGKEELKKALIDIVKACGYRENASVRQTLYVAGNGSWGSNGPVGMFIAPIKRKKTSAEYNKKGLHVCVSSWRRISDTMLSPRIKCGANYINSRMGQREALKNGYDTCLFLNDSGKVSEGPGSCFFMVKNGKLVTPGLTESVLESITRDTVIKIAADMGMEVEERGVDRTEVYTADEAFLCGSAMEITPVLSVDRHMLNDGMSGGVTGEVHELYRQIVTGRNDRYKKWLCEIV